MAPGQRHGREADAHRSFSSPRSLTKRVNDVVARSYAGATIHKYNGMWRKFATFMDKLDPHWTTPIPVTSLACYGVFLHDQGYKPGTINSHLAGIGWWHKLQGYPDPSKQFLMRRLAVGLTKSGPPVKQAKPIRFPLLMKMVEVLPCVVPTEEVDLYRAAFMLAYFASLRVSEFATTSSSDHTLLLDNTTFQETQGGWGLVITFPSFKASERPVKLLVPPATQPSQCPVQAVAKYLVSRPSGSGPIFLRPNGKPLSAYLVNKTIKACVSFLGLNPDDYSSHSFRAGRTTDLVEMDLQDSTIRVSGRWKSSAYLQYVRFDLFKLPGGAPPTEGLAQLG